MDFLIETAHAQGTPQADPFGFLLPMLVIFAAFYFLLIRPQQKRQKAHSQLVAGLSVGDEVVTAGGMLRSGWTRLWNSPITSPRRTFTAPTSVMRSWPGDNPVVSRSTTTKVTS